MPVELYDLELIRREDGHRFERRRIAVDPDDQVAITAHMRGIAVACDRQNPHRDNWLSAYEAALYRAGKDQPLALISALGDEET